jgi:hypothetical protein
MITEKIQIKGTPTFTLINEHGVVVNKFTAPNIITSSGRNYIASRMCFASTTPVMNWIGIGTGGTPTLFTDYKLDTEVARVAITSVTNNQNTITYSAVFGPGVGTGIIKEAGTFNSATINIGIVSRIVFPQFTKAAGDTINVDWAYEIL